MGGENWTRPASVPFPSVWREFEGRKSKKQFWVQDCPEEYHEEVLHLMKTEFIRDEPLCSRTEELTSDKVSMKEFEDVWRKCLVEKLVLLCLTKDENGKNKIAAINMTMRSYKVEPHPEWQGKCSKKIFGTIEYVYEKTDYYSLLKIDSYLTALGLLVLPEFRGEGIGLEVLKAREPLCRAVGLKATLTAFTSVISQKLAERAGFKDLSSVPYDEIEAAGYSYPGIQKMTKSLRHMYLLYQ